MNTVQYLNRTFSVPSSWDEFTNDQLILITQLILSGMDPVRIKTILATHVIGLSGHLRPFAGNTYFVPGKISKFQLLAFRAITRKKAYLVSPEDIFFISELFNFMFIPAKYIEDDEKPLVRNVLLKRNFLPVIKSGKTLLYGTSEYYGNCTTAEYIAAENHYTEFINSASVENLDNLCAALYRPIVHLSPVKKLFIHSGADIRQPFDDNYLDNASCFSKIPLWQKFAVLLMFEGVRNYFMLDYPEIYTSSDEATDTENNNQSAWPMVVRSVAGHVTNIEKVLSLNIHSFMFELNQSIIDARKVKSITPKQ